jgi:hypothetical protein
MRMMTDALGSTKMADLTLQWGDSHSSEHQDCIFSGIHMPSGEVGRGGGHSSGGDIQEDKLSPCLPLTRLSINRHSAINRTSGARQAEI